MKQAKPAKRGKVRIIAGQWRGSRISLPDGLAARPTPDRVRETVFNWLAPIIEGAHCLDLFAGTGVLGLEALSRGAASTCFVDQDAAAIGLIDEQLERFHVEDAQGRVVLGDVREFLASEATPCDVVFLDPPYADNSLRDLCKLLERGWLSPAARVYLELSRRDTLPPLPDNWQLLREKTASQVRFALAQRN